MAALPALVMLALTVTLGGVMGLRYLRREKRRLWMVGVHLLLALGGLEALLIALSGAPEGDAAPGGQLGKTAGVLLAIAMLIGFARAILVPRAPRHAGLTLAAHAAAGAAGFLTLLAWAAAL